MTTNGPKIAINAVIINNTAGSKINVNKNVAKHLKHLFSIFDCNPFRFML